MRVHSTRLLGLAVAASIVVAPSIGRAQLPAPRSSTQISAPPVPTVVRPAEGQVVTGDLAITVQVPAGVRATKYSIEAAYWDAARNTWVYPGTLGSDFGGGTTATTTIAAEVRVKFSPTATRWRVHVHATDPPGGWGPWREFTWQPAAIAPRSSETPQPSASASAALPNPGPPNTPAPAAAAAKGAATMPNPGPPNTATPVTPIGKSGATLPNPGPPTAAAPAAAGAKSGAAYPDPGPPGARTTPSSGVRPAYPNPGPPDAPIGSSPGGKAAYPNPGPPNAPAPATAGVKGAAAYPNPGPPTAPTAATAARKGAATVPDPGPPDATVPASAGAKSAAAYPNPGPPQAPTASMAAAGLLNWFDGSVASRKIVGTGAPNDASGKIGDFRRRLASIRSAIESGKTGDACAQIQILHLEASKLLKGTDTRALLNRISALRGQLGCM